MRGPPVGAVLLALVLLAAPLLTVTLVVGGPPAEEADGGGTVWRPRVESWTLVSAGPGGGEVGGLLCSDEKPCDRNLTASLAARGDPCAWTGRIWLTTGSLASAFPVVLLDPEILIYAVVESGDGRALSGDRRNFSLDLSQFPLDWEEGVWWRAESQRVQVTVPVPCDATGLKVALNVHGRSLMGETYQGAQTAEARLVEA